MDEFTCCALPTRELRARRRGPFDDCEGPRDEDADESREASRRFEPIPTLTGASGTLMWDMAKAAIELSEVGTPP